MKHPQAEDVFHSFSREGTGTAPRCSKNAAPGMPTARRWLEEFGEEDANGGTEAMSRAEWQRDVGKARGTSVKPERTAVKSERNSVNSKVT